MLLLLATAYKLSFHFREIILLLLLFLKACQKQQGAEDKEPLQNSRVLCHREEARWSRALRTLYRKSNNPKQERVRGEGPTFTLTRVTLEGHSTNKAGPIRAQARLSQCGPWVRVSESLIWHSYLRWSITQGQRESISMGRRNLESATRGLVSMTAGAVDQQPPFDLYFTLTKIKEIRARRVLLRVCSQSHDWNESLKKSLRGADPPQALKWNGREYTSESASCNTNREWWAYLRNHPSIVTMCFCSTTIFLICLSASYAPWLPPDPRSLHLTIAYSCSLLYPCHHSAQHPEGASRYDREMLKTA
ncbi:uncharacterized protein BDR25DRAFT_350106 [Lindgomyces ingoldianus]|uniref:Uncharacterized protein n=1 Tax=Lindgomyces ingoldianus TaxID=673940 RepID=A0ACB6R990_9PLEO|nr:uncharacterized protein BDR25DRAFT_350106 [Lindgomyces ingoldianus]KAF2475824.1 hypothetical protein BDR25DRAFT_350106 [Lindgomyces ingoldianus]